MEGLRRKVRNDKKREKGTQDGKAGYGKKGKRKKGEGKRGKGS